ncbi:MAG: NAD-dependent epimerase/dehydratase family protein [Dehalococcoidales bacterium]
MKVIVTGGAGFIGSNLVDELIKRKIEVVVVDDLSTGFKRNVNPLAKFYYASICDRELKLIFEKEKPDVVFHLAAQTAVSRSIADPYSDARINILGSLNVISNCVECGVKKIVYSSSCALYGTPEYLPVDEKHPVNPLSPYGISKHTVEHYLSVNNQLHGLSYIALRYANVYGPRQNPLGEGGVIAIFCGKMLAGEQPTIFGAGDKSRDYVFVADVVQANIRAMESTETGIYNIGTGIETYDNMIFDMIASECGYLKNPKYSPERKGEIKRIYLDNTQAVIHLGWKPQVGTKDGIPQTVMYYRIIRPEGFQTKTLQTNLSPGEILR